MLSWFWIQLIAFQALWFSAVLGGNEWIIIPLALIAMHFLFTPSRRLDWRVLPLAFIGIGADSVLTWSGVLAFDHPPVWLAVLWVGFILTLSHSLAWLQRLPGPLLIPLGALAGSASYLAGWKLEAVNFPLGLTWSLVALVCLWSVLLPVLVRLNFYIRARV